ncbi:MAG: tRNA 2-thiocytidine biosynthesis protein TtcA [Ruminococcus sp.]|nr:tRNA 2-thiocytidine biosynthesis protein TtcA [Ruminococcus sp.]
MDKILSAAEQAQRSITKTYRREIWNPFIKAIKDYELIQEGDRIAVCISGGKDSMLLAVCMKLLREHSDFPFEVCYLSMDPGYNEENRKKLEENAEMLEIPIEFFETNIFNVAFSAEKYPCYLCAKMRRGHLYKQAKELGCNKIALGHHFSDVIETTVMALFYSSQLQGMMPKLHSENYEGMELIRPLYCVREEDIIRWRNYNHLSFLDCACRFTESVKHSEDGIGESKRAETKALIRELKKTNPNIEKSIFNALHAVHLDTFPAYKTKGEYHSFLEEYENDKKPS